MPSKLYASIFHARNESILYVKDKWEMEAGSELSEQAWGEIFGAFNGLHPVPWIGENTVRKKLVDISKHHYRRNTKMQGGLVGDSVAQRWASAFILSGNAQS